MKKLFGSVMTKIKGFKFSRRVFAYPYILFLMVFIVLPLVMVLINAFLGNGKLTFDNFATFFKEANNFLVLARSIAIGFITTLLCLIIGYPVAYLLVKHNSGRILVLLFILPMWVNFLIRTLATRLIFTSLDISLGYGTVIFGMVYNYLPFMILPLHTTISNIDKSFMEAAKDLGADNMTVFLKTILPLSVPGIMSGITMVFVPTISTFAISELLSQNSIQLFGDYIFTAFDNDLWGVGSIMSIIMLIILFISNAILAKSYKGTNVSGRNVW